MTLSYGAGDGKRVGVAEEKGGEEGFRGEAMGFFGLVG
jgi:hypothetical protein